MFFAFIIPFAVAVGAIMLGQREPVRAPSPSPTRSAVSGSAPSPIAVLYVFLRGGHRPPPIVVQCAIAEAQLIGRYDLAYDLAHTFGADLPPQTLHVTSPDEIEAFLAKGNAPNEDATIESAPVAPAPPIEVMMPSEPSDSSEPVDHGGSFDLPPAPVIRPVSVASPIHGVPDDRWSRFCSELAREAPTFQSQRHVGRYRHRKDRLAEVGFDPEAIVGSSDAQDAALCADLADAHRHLVASGMIRKHVGRHVSLPEVDGSVPVTLSGVLGLASVAGLEGATGWLERKADRKKFPHTTMAFARTNGVF